MHLWILSDKVTSFPDFSDLLLLCFRAVLFLIIGTLIDKVLGFVGLCAWSLSRVQLFVTPWTVARLGSSIHAISQAKILGWVE